MTHHAKNPVFILAAPGFEESQTIHHLSALREKGIPTSLIGLSCQGVHGRHGITINPDYALSDLKSTQSGALVLIPGGRQCISRLTADPRVHDLINNTLANNGVLAATKSAEPILEDTCFRSLLNGRHYHPQGDMELNEFSDYLIDLIS